MYVYVEFNLDGPCFGCVVLMIFLFRSSVRGGRGGGVWMMAVLRLIKNNHFLRRAGFLVRYAPGHSSNLGAGPLMMEEYPFAVGRVGEIARLEEILFSRQLMVDLRILRGFIVNRHRGQG